MKKLFCMLGFLFVFLTLGFINVNAAEVDDDNHNDHQEESEQNVSQLFYVISSEIGYNSFYISARCSKCNAGTDIYGNPCSTCSPGEAEAFNGVFFDINYSIYQDYVDVTVYVYSNKGEVMITYFKDFGTSAQQGEYVYFYYNSYTFSYRFTTKSPYNLIVWVYGQEIELASFTIE